MAHAFFEPGHDLHSKQTDLQKTLMSDTTDFRAALSDATNAMFEALNALKSGDVTAATKLLEAAHAEAGELLIEAE